jgi:hypothetical protein
LPLLRFSHVSDRLPHPFLTLESTTLEKFFHPAYIWAAHADGQASHFCRQMEEKAEKKIVPRFPIRPEQRLRKRSPRTAPVTARPPRAAARAQRPGSGGANYRNSFPQETQLEVE